MAPAVCVTLRTSTVISFSRDTFLASQAPSARSRLPKLHPTISTLTISARLLLRQNCSETTDRAGAPAPVAVSKGAGIGELFQEFGELVESHSGNGQAVAQDADAVLQQVKRELPKLKGVDQQLIFEIHRLIKLLEMDLLLLRAARKGATLTLRLQDARSHSLQAARLTTLI